MATDDFFRARLDAMIDLKHPLALLATRLPWAAIEAAVAPKLARQVLVKRARGAELLGAYDAEFGGGVNPAGRPRLPPPLDGQPAVPEKPLQAERRRTCRTLGLERAVAVLQRHGRLRTAPAVCRHPDRALPPPAGRGRQRALFKATIECAVQIKAVLPADLERVIVDSTVQSKAIAHPVDSRLLEIARHKVVSAAKRAGFSLKPA